MMREEAVLVSGEMPYELRRWAAALSNRGQDRATILAIGDSITEGLSLSSLDDRWTERLQEFLQDRYPTDGVGRGGGYMASYYADGRSDPGLPEPLRTGPVFERTLRGIGYRALELGTGGSITYPSVVGTSVRLVYSTVGYGSPLEVSVDGDPPIVLPTHVSGQGEYLDRWTDLSLGGLVDSVHTLTIARGDGGAFAPQVGGIQVFNGDEHRGVQVVDAGHGAWRASHFASGARGVSSQQSDLADWVPAVEADLALIALGTNDWINGISTGSFSQDMQTVISELRVHEPNLPIVLIGWWYPGDQNWQRYLDEMHALSSANTDVSVVDFNAGDAIAFTDGLHPSAEGAEYIARTLSDVLSAGLPVGDDGSAPIIQPIAPSEGAEFALGQEVEVAFTCADESSGSGLAGCEGTSAIGELLDTGATGPHQFTIEAVDFAGNSSATVVSYAVVDRPYCLGHRVTVEIGRGEAPTSGDDVILGTQGDDVIRASSGNDHVCGLGGADDVALGEGDDVATGGAGADWISGGHGADLALGGTNGDVLLGGDGPDRLDGGVGADQLSGGVGGDVHIGGAGIDSCDGGPGADRTRLCETLAGIP